VSGGYWATVLQENVDLVRRSWELASQGADDEVACCLAALEAAGLRE
jgi:hypothetical protein